LSVRARPIGIDGKEETIAVIEEWIDHHGNIVIHLQLRIACKLSGDDGCGRAVETGYTEEKGVFVDENADFRLFAWAFPFFW
jgi:hypothetical protein